MPRRDDHPVQTGLPDATWGAAGSPAAGDVVLDDHVPQENVGKLLAGEKSIGRKPKKGKKAKHRARPGQIDPQAAPRFGSSPFPGLPHPLGATPYQG